MRSWTDMEISWLEVLYPDTRTQDIAQLLGRSTRAVNLKSRKLGLRKSAAYLADPRRSGRFTVAHETWNKGTHFQAGGRSVQTQFKPGRRPHTWRPIGTETRDADGYLKRKVREGARPSTYNWRFVHQLVWEEHHGPVPKGHAVVFRNGDKTDIRIDNLECISRAELQLRNSIWRRYPRPVAEAIIMRGALKRRIRETQEERREGRNR